MPGDITMGKIDKFSRVLDRLDIDDKDKLLASAHRLLKAQSVVKVDSTKPKPAKKKPTAKKAAT
jgi:hypothetical protein